MNLMKIAILCYSKNGSMVLNYYEKMENIFEIQEPEISGKRHAQFQKKANKR